MNECDRAALPLLSQHPSERTSGSTGAAGWEEEEAAFLFGEAERIDMPRNRPLHVDICLPLLGGCLSVG